MDDENKKATFSPEEIERLLHPTPPHTAAARWAHLTHLLRDRYFLAALGAILLTGLSLTAVFASVPPEHALETKALKKAAPKVAPKVYSPLTGLEVASEPVTKQPVTAIMIENSPDARPQSGLKDAGVVFEAIAEGGITRFIALYQEAKPQLIGPVRSVRPYYVEWAAAFDASVAHIGGSKRALDMIRSGDYGTDLDQFFNAVSYWRVADRYAPHNVYTSFEKLDALVAAKGRATSSFTAWPRADGKAAKQPTATGIDIPVSSGSYIVRYEYLAASNTYKRLQGGEAHVDREGGQITPSVIIAMKVPMSIGMEDGYREQITTIGSGKAYIFQNGVIIEATWAKAGPKSQLTFTDSADKPVSLNRGQTWVTALADTKEVTWQ